MNIKIQIITATVVYVAFLIMAIITISTLKNRTSAHEAETVLHEVTEVRHSDDGLVALYDRGGIITEQLFKPEYIHCYEGESEIVALYPKGSSHDKALKMYLYLSMEDYYMYAWEQEITE